MDFSYNFFLWTLLLLPLANCNNYNYIELSCPNSITHNKELKGLIKRTLSFLIDKTPAKGFTSSNLSSRNYILYGLAQCRGDANPDLCSKCIFDAGRKLQANCADQTKGYVLYDMCFLHYDTVNFLGKLNGDGTEFFWHNDTVAKDPLTFASTVNRMVDNLKAMVIAPEANLFATAVERIIPDIEGVNLYGMVQCTGDLEKSACSQCLDHLVQSLIPLNCEKYIGCKLLYCSCFLIYETYDFFK